MFTNLFTFLCESSSVDGTDGKLSAYKLFENFQVPIGSSDQVAAGTILQFNFDLICGWVMPKENSKPLTLEIIKAVLNPTAEVIASASSPLELPALQRRFNIRENITGVPIKGFGEYSFKITVKQGDKVVGEASYPFMVAEQE